MFRLWSQLPGWLNSRLITVCRRRRWRGCAPPPAGGQRAVQCAGVLVLSHPHHCASYPPCELWVLITVHWSNVFIFSKSHKLCAEEEEEEDEMREKKGKRIIKKALYTHILSLSYVRFVMSPTSIYSSCVYVCVCVCVCVRALRCGDLCALGLPTCWRPWVSFSN